MERTYSKIMPTQLNDCAKALVLFGTARTYRQLAEVVSCMAILLGAQPGMTTVSQRRPSILSVGHRAAQSYTFVSTAMIYGVIKRALTSLAICPSCRRLHQRYNLCGRSFRYSAKVLAIELVLVDLLALLILK
jgi:hypothetical protein